MTTGPDADFTALVQRQSRFVFQVSYAVLLNSHDAEDAVQETFLKLYRNRGWQNAENERAFLARVAWRVAVDLRPRVSRHSVSLQDSNEPEEAPSSRPDPEESLLSANQHAMVHRMIDTLAEELRVPLILSAFEQLSSREIGVILGIPQGTVRTRLQRARQILRQKLSAMEPRSVEVRHA